MGDLLFLKHLPLHHFVQVVQKVSPPPVESEENLQMHREKEENHRGKVVVLGKSVKMVNFQVNKGKAENFVTHLYPMHLQSLTG